MPIRILKKIAAKLTRKSVDGDKSDGAKRAASSRSKKNASSEPPEKGGSSRKIPANEVWRPGQPVPPVKGAFRSETASAGQKSKEKPARGSRPRRSPSVRPSVTAEVTPTEKRPPTDQASENQTGESSQKTGRSRSSRRRSRSRSSDGSGSSSDASSSGIPSSSAPEGAAPAVAAVIRDKPWSLDDYVVPAVEGKFRFQDVDLPESIQHGVADLGYQYCTPIQAHVLKKVLDGHNVAGKAQTGTGKTAAFLILTFKQFLQNPLGEDRPCGKPRALILAPTRELVIQIVRDAEDIGKYCGLRSVAVYGGADYDRQERDLLSSPVDLIAATPGRLLDFCRKRTLDLSGVEVLVIDEADRMLDMGFIPDVRTIVRSTPPKERRRTLLFSATLSADVMRLASQWMPDPQIIEIEPEHVAVDTIKQLVYMVKANEKFTVLYNLLKRPAMGRVLVFANRRDQTDRIAFELQRYGVACELLSGAVDQKKRMRVLDDFRSGKVKTVVATDVAGRGLHVADIDHVVNFDLPYEAEDYVHRIGRTGRAGAEGTAVSFACEDESFGIPEIEKFIGETLACKYPEDILLTPLPSTKSASYVRPPRRDFGASSGGRSGSRSGRPGSGRSPRR